MYPYNSISVPLVLLKVFHHCLQEHLYTVKKNHLSLHYLYKVNHWIWTSTFKHSLDIQICSIAHSMAANVTIHFPATLLLCRVCHIYVIAHSSIHQSENKWGIFVTCLFFISPEKTKMIKSKIVGETWKPQKYWESLTILWTKHKATM